MNVLSRFMMSAWLLKIAAVCSRSPLWFSRLLIPIPSRNPLMATLRERCKELSAV